MNADPSQAPRGWLRPVSEACLRLLIVGAAVYALLYVAARLRLVVVPLVLALALATLLEPLVRRLRERGVPAGAAAFLVLAGALAVVGGLAAALVPRTIAEFGGLDVSITGGVEIVQGWLSQDPVGLSDEQMELWLERAEEELRENAGRITGGAVTGATLLIEVAAGLSLAIVLLFFVLKDGERIWRWVLDLMPGTLRREGREVGDRVWSTLGGYLRGITLVALFDAAFIALALMVIGVPLVLPLAVLTFAGAFIPIAGAVLAGLAAVLVALVAIGPLAALAVAAAVLVVQQVEGNLLQPLVVGRSVHVHPIAILLAVTAGGVLGGIPGAFVATPVVGVAAAVLRYVRFEREGA